LQAHKKDDGIQSGLSNVVRPPGLVAHFFIYGRNEMPFLKNFRLWYWRGSPATRALASALVALGTAALFLPIDVESAKFVLVLGLNWTIGAYGMDKAYVHRLK
jgi:hypothetical protein